jgi:hypothetical protein
MQWLFSEFKMVFDNNDRLYDAFENALMGINPEPIEDTGVLGYQDDQNLYTVYSSVNRDRFRVRLDDGSNIDAKHNGSVQPIPNLNVIVKYDRLNQPYIDGPDTSKQSAYAGTMASQLSVGPHSHHRNSGMEFPIDPILLTYFQPLVESDRTISIQPGDYVDTNGQIQWFSGSVIDLSDVTVTTGYHRWVLILLDKTLGTLDYQNGSEKIETLPLLESEVNQFTIPYDQDPLHMIKVRSGYQSLLQQDIVALFGGRSGGSSSVERGIIVTIDNEILIMDNWVVRYNTDTDTFFTLE